MQQLDIDLIHIHSQTASIEEITFYTKHSRDFLSTLLKHTEQSEDIPTYSEVYEYCKDDSFMAETMLMTISYSNATREATLLDDEVVRDLYTLHKKVFCQIHNIRPWKVPYLKRLYSDKKIS
jgi:hypothetical protein